MSKLVLLLPILMPRELRWTPLSRHQIAEISSLDEEIWPREYYRIREKALSGALGILKNYHKKKDAEKKRLKKEIERLRNIVLSQAEEIDLLKKRPIGTIRIYIWL
jgi:hypothetical protein